MQYPQPPEPVLKKIYPWDEYNVTLVVQWLYAQAQKTGFIGTFEDFKLRYGKFIAALDPQDWQDMIDNYTGTYHITPLADIQQVLKTKNKVLDQNIIIDPIPEELICSHKEYEGSYSITPLTRVDQLVRTKNKLLNDNIVVQRIPYTEIDNDAGGRTVAIG